ncbi:MAG: hypothetical protein BWY68_00472 [bacterium ADurb.Bin400]|nr:MAG: hypothetical protein BWY68_00472 [bacterium ADurb.Bin400]
MPEEYYCSKCDVISPSPECPDCGGIASPIGDVAAFEDTDFEEEDGKYDSGLFSAIADDEELLEEAV